VIWFSFDRFVESSIGMLMHITRLGFVQILSVYVEGVLCRGKSRQLSHTDKGMQRDTFGFCLEFFSSILSYNWL